AGGERTPARHSRMAAASACASLRVATGGEVSFTTGLDPDEAADFVGFFMRHLLHPIHRAAPDSHRGPRRPAAALPVARHTVSERLADRRGLEVVPRLVPAPLAGRVRSPSARPPLAARSPGHQPDARWTVYPRPVQ